MLFRPKATGPIVIDRSGVHSETPEVAARLQRISQNYEQFDAVFAAIEGSLTLDLPPTSDSREGLDSQFNANLRRRKPR